MVRTYNIHICSPTPTPCIQIYIISAISLYVSHAQCVKSDMKPRWIAGGRENVILSITYKVKGSTVDAGLQQFCTRTRYRMQVDNVAWILCFSSLKFGVSGFSSIFQQQSFKFHRGWRTRSI